ncbi:6-bladed beta-propeller, partial [Citrobacter sp. AAK_AS5]
FKKPLGIAADSSGLVYVADSRNNRIQVFNASGAFVTAWGAFGTANGQFDLPSDIAIDSLGNVYVADAGNHRIQKFTAAGD